MDKFIPLSVPNFVGNEKKYVLDAVDAGWVSTGGQLIVDFENAIKKYINASYAVAVQSGTAGLHLAMKVLGVGEGDEVIVPTLTFIAAVNPVTYLNASPVFMDCDDTLCMDMNKLESFIKEECEFDGETLKNKTTGKRISAVVAVHIFGNLCNMEKLMDLASKYKFKVIEDATEALGTYFKEGKYKGIYAGLVGDAGVYSFNGNKIITTGGGGMIVTNSEQVASKCKYLSTQAKDDVLYFVHNEIGYNYRLTNVQAALGVAQMESLANFVQIKIDNYNNYINNGIKLVPFRSDIHSNHWFYSYLTQNPEKRDSLIKFLDANNIQSRPIWTLIHTLPPYKNAINYKIEKAYEFFERVVNIPCSTSLTKEDVEYVAKKIKEWETNED